MKINNIVLQVTKKCDQFCPHCFFDSSPSSLEELSFKQVKIGLINLKNAGVDNVNKFVITGGEPTLFLGLGKLISFIKSEYPSSLIRLDTNGINFYCNQELFKKIGADIYDISVDSFHNAGIKRNSKTYKDIFVNDKGKSRILDFLLKIKKNIILISMCDGRQRSYDGFAKFMV